MTGGLLIDEPWTLSDQEAARFLIENAKHLPAGYYERLHAPLLMAIPPEWQLAKHKLLIIGQETYGWHFSGPQVENYCYLCGLVGVEDPVGALVQTYAEFDFANSSRAQSKPFWRAQRQLCERIEDGNRRRVLWTNVARCSVDPPLGKEGYSAWNNSSYEELDALCAWQSRLLKSEIASSGARHVLFFTGPNYDYILRKSLNNLHFSPVWPDVPERQFARVHSPDLPPSTYRTYHPGYLRRNPERWAWLDRLVEEISKV